VVDLLPPINMGPWKGEDDPRDSRPHLPPCQIGGRPAWHPAARLGNRAVTEKLEASLKREEKPWVRLAGGLKHLHKETVRINRIIKSEFEKIEPEDWK
jgi:hypothetical protein